MRIIKEYCEHNNTVILRTDCYSKRLSSILELFETAKIDFPFLKVNDVEVIYYAGERYKRTYGIEFLAQDAPTNYLRVNSLEFSM